MSAQSAGMLSGSGICVGVSCLPNTAPLAAFASPADGRLFPPGAEIIFSGSGSNHETGLDEAAPSSRSRLVVIAAAAELHRPHTADGLYLPQEPAPEARLPIRSETISHAARLPHELPGGRLPALARRRPRRLPTAARSSARGAGLPPGAARLTASHALNVRINPALHAAIHQHRSSQGQTPRRLMR